MNAIGHSLSLWTNTSHFAIAVACPVLFWGLVLGVEACRGNYTQELCRWWLIGAVMTFFMGRWSDTPAETSLHLVCAFSLICFVLVHCKKAVPPLLAGALVFFNLLMNDVLHATVRSWQHVFDSNSFLTGVGGGGVQDGLVLFPIFTTLVLVYANWRLRKVQKMALWY